jgi:hypothetical protein
MFKLVKGRRQFAADKERSKEREAGCNKEFNTHQDLTPGLF